MSDAACVSENKIRPEHYFDRLLLLLRFLHYLIKLSHLISFSPGFDSLSIDGSSFPHIRPKLLSILLDLALSFALL